MKNRLLNLYAENRGKPAYARIVQANGGEVEILLYGVISSDREEAMFFGGVSPEDLVSALNEAAGRPVRLRIHSPGGSAYGGLAMATAVSQYAGEVVAQIDSIAASAASVVAVAAQRVEMPPWATIMIHKAWALIAANADGMLSAAAELERMDGQLAEVYLGKTGLPMDQIMEMMRSETEMTAEQAIELGFADVVIESKQRGDTSPANAAGIDAAQYLRRIESLTIEV